MLRSILPSFVADVVFPHHRPAWKVHPTSYLDGLRGLASIIVFFCHYTEENHSYLIPSYGMNPDQTPSSWIQLPFLRLIFSGRPMVHIFFIISGFALSYKPIKMIHAGQLDRCFSVLSSSAFRRPIRLFGPCVVSTFLIVLLIQVGWLYQPLPSFSTQFWLWADVVFHGITWPWAWDFDLRPGYDVHLWTIPIEFIHSMLLFMVIVILSRVKLLVRQCAVMGLMTYCLACGKWAGFEFLGGLFLAEMHLLKSAPALKEWEASELIPYPPPRRLSAWTVFRTVFHLGLIVGTLFIGGWPNFDAENTPGIRYLLAKTPEPFASMDPLAPQKFWFAIGAAFLVWSCGELDFIRKFLENEFSQYCGRISYAVYIVHGPVLGMFQQYVIGTALVPPEGDYHLPGYRPAVPASGVKGLIGTQSPIQRTASWLVGLFILGPVVIWAADVFWRAVDTPIIGLAKKLETICLDDTQNESDHGSRNQGYSLAG